MADPTKVERLRELVLLDVHDFLFVLNDGQRLSTRARTADTLDALIAEVRAEQAAEIERLRFVIGEMSATALLGRGAHPTWPRTAKAIARMGDAAIAAKEGVMTK